MSNLWKRRPKKFSLREEIWKRIRQAMLIPCTGIYEECKDCRFVDFGDGLPNYCSKVQEYFYEEVNKMRSLEKCRENE